MSTLVCKTPGGYINDGLAQVTRRAGRTLLHEALPSFSLFDDAPVS